jgi:hypothetical protein
MRLHLKGRGWLAGWSAGRLVAEQLNSRRRNDRPATSPRHIARPDLTIYKNACLLVVLQAADIRQNKCRPAGKNGRRPRKQRCARSLRPPQSVPHTSHDSGASLIQIH